MKRTVLLSACLSLWTASAVSAPVDDTEPLPLGLKEVTGCPEAYKVPFELRLLFHSTGKIYNPFYTEFEPTAFLNFSAWAANAPMWTREGYQSDHPFFYVDRRRNPKTELEVIQLKPFTWIKVVCVVRSTSHGKAWIEILSLKDIDMTMPWSEVQKMIRGHVLAEQGQFERAVSEFNTLQFKGMPKAFVASCKHSIGRAALLAGKRELALANLRYAMQIFPEDLDIVTAYEAAQSGQTVAIAYSEAAAARENEKKRGEKASEQAGDEASDKVDPDSLEEWPDENNPADSEPGAESAADHPTESPDPATAPETPPDDSQETTSEEAGTGKEATSNEVDARESSQDGSSADGKADPVTSESLPSEGSESKGDTAPAEKDPSPSDAEKPQGSKPESAPEGTDKTPVENPDG